MPQTAQSHDRALIQELLAGDPRAADLFVARFSRLVWWILIHQVRLAPEPAEEVYQDVFVHLWEDGYRRLRNWSGEGDFAAYLAPIVRHRALDRVRKESGKHERPLFESGDEPRPEPADDRPGPDELTLIDERRVLLEEAVAGLGEKERRLYELRYQQEQSYEAISSSLGITVNLVGVRLVRLTERLRNVIAGNPSPKPPAGGPAVRLPGPGPSPE